MVDGKISEIWEEADLLGLMQQLGATVIRERSRFFWPLFKLMTHYLRVARRNEVARHRRCPDGFEDGDQATQIDTS